MVTKVNMKGFRDDKREHFCQAEDLVQLGYRSTVSAAIMDLLPLLMLQLLNADL